MKISTLALGIGALAVSLGVVGLTAGNALAYRGDATVKGPNYTVERHTAMTQAFANNDYDAWKKLMVGQGRVLQVINKDNFAKFAQAHNLSQQGKTVEANKIRQELGLGMHDGSGKGMGKGNGKMGSGFGRNSHR